MAANKGCDIAIGRSCEHIGLAKMLIRLDQLTGYHCKEPERRGYPEWMR